MAVVTKFTGLANKTVLQYDNDKQELTAVSVPSSLQNTTVIAPTSDKLTHNVHLIKNEYYLDSSSAWIPKAQLTDRLVLPVANTYTIESDEFIKGDKVELFDDGKIAYDKLTKLQYTHYPINGRGATWLDLIKLITWENDYVGYTLITNNKDYQYCQNNSHTRLQRRQYYASDLPYEIVDIFTNVKNADHTFTDDNDIDIFETITMAKLEHANIVQTKIENNKRVLIDNGSGVYQFSFGVRFTLPSGTKKLMTGSILTFGFSMNISYYLENYYTPIPLCEFTYIQSKLSIKPTNITPPYYIPIDIEHDNPYNFTISDLQTYQPDFYSYGYIISIDNTIPLYTEALNFLKLNDLYKCISFNIISKELNNKYQYV